MTRLLLWAVLIFAAANWVLFTLGLVLGAADMGRLVLAVVCSLVAVALANEVKPWEKS
jgi:hypothetical protein